jgi:CDP-2,3-bis-(O-geranylgeranyl)-sn-glycerol synthase
MSFIIIIQALWLILPAYIANGSALLLGGGKPIDFGLKFKDGKRILGDGKTWRGLFFGGFFGMTAGFGFSIVAKYSSFYEETSWLYINDFTGFPIMIPILFSICFGALFGDIIESFFKRRFGKNRGDNWIPFDQLDFIIGVLFFTFIMSGILNFFNFTTNNWFFQNFTHWHILSLLILTPFFHIFANFIHLNFKTKNTKKQNL